MKKSRKVLLATLGVLLLVLVLQYTLGGGWKYVRRAIKRHEIEKHMEGPWQLPPDMGPEDAKVKFTVILSTMNGCHKEFAEAIVKTLSPYTDKVRVDFKDSSEPDVPKLLEGYPISCEMSMLLNGLNEIKVPWQKGTIILQGPEGGEGFAAPDFDRLIKWALSEEGQKSLKEQWEAFEKERQKRLAKMKERQRKKAAKAKKKAEEAKKQSGKSAEEGTPSQETIPSEGGPASTESDSPAQKTLREPPKSPQGEIEPVAPSMPPQGMPTG